ncbi:hypothetical protein [Reyranella sp.]|uniref:hypothetical protein n=1 Tax=Reyranella sp. TaxID=1929291 RepID=UPI003BAD865E
MTLLGVVGTDRLAKLRDGIIAAGTITYLTGFLVVASYSTWQGFGLTKVLDAQYIVAGLLPALMLFVTFQLLWAAKRTVDGLRVDVLDVYSKSVLQLAAGGPTWRLRLADAMLPLLAVTWVLLRTWLFRLSLGVFIGGLYASQIDALVTRSRYQEITFGMGFVAFIALSVAGVALGFGLLNLVKDLKAGPSTGVSVARWAAMIYLLPIPLILGIALIALAQVYVTRIFPLVPIEFGGAAPRCVLVAAKENTWLTRKAADKKEGVTLVPLTLQLPSDPYVFTDDDNHIWQIARDQVLAMRNCQPASNPGS